jgi:hypothetical protein
MHSAEYLLKIPPQRRRLLTAFSRVAASPRLYVYLACAVIVLVISYLLGKDMRWDTLDYHFYAGFSALHNRFDQDYFAAGSQSYFNPYAYAPFYLLASSGLSSLVVASMFAVLHSAILWLTYELALEVVPAADDRAKIKMAILATGFAFANPILINQLGSSYADITTAEGVLVGWLLLVRAVRAPSMTSVICAGLLLGAVSALKMTNTLHALCAVVLLLFLSADWRTRLRHAVAFGVALALGFVIVCAPWSLHLERNFGNPLFPLLNSVFRSPQFPTAKMMDYRFVPDSLAAALLRPFAIVMPRFAVDDELQAPDVRYAVALVAATLLLLAWLWRRSRRSPGSPPDPAEASMRPLAALGCGLLVDWTLWLTASGNGRYFLAMACIAGVVGIALVCRLFAGRPNLRNYALIVILGVQALQLRLGADYREFVPWDGKPWFEVAVPGALATAPALYFTYGVQSNSFIVPFLAKGSGVVNLAGDFPLVRHGINGQKVDSLIHRYAPHLRLIIPEARVPGNPHPVISLAGVNYALQSFGLRSNAGDCATIVASDQGPQPLGVTVVDPMPASTPPTEGASGAKTPIAQPEAGYFATCSVVPDPVNHEALTDGEHKAELIFDRLEDACPAVFQPRRPVTVYFGEKFGAPIWARRYLNTNITAWIARGWVQFIDPVRGGPAQYIAPISGFEKTSPRFECGRRDGGYYAHMVRSSR